ncbi:MAG: hypothetical protein AB7N61_26825 [Acidimicrobiia bacterium]
MTAQASSTVGSGSAPTFVAGPDVTVAQESMSVVLSPKAPGPIHVEAKPGTEASVTITVANASGIQTRSVSLAVSTGSDSAERAAWVRLSDQQMSLEPSQTREVTLTFTVPREAVPGATSYSVFASDFPGGPPISNSLSPELVVSGTPHAVLSITDVRLTDSSGGEAFQITIRNSGTAQGSGTVTLSPVGLGTISAPLRPIEAGTVDAVLVPFAGAVAGTKYVTDIVVDYGNGDTAGWRGRVTAGDHTNRGESASDPYTPSTTPSAPPTSVSADGTVTSLGTEATPPAKPKASSSNWAGPAVLGLGVIIAIGFVLGSRRRGHRPMVVSAMAAPTLPGSDHLRDAIVTLANQVAHLADEMGRQRAASTSLHDRSASIVGSSLEDDQWAPSIDDASVDAVFDTGEFDADEFEFEVASAEVDSAEVASAEAASAEVEGPAVEAIAIEPELWVELLPVDPEMELAESEPSDTAQIGTVEEVATEVSTASIPDEVESLDVHDDPEDSIDLMATEADGASEVEMVADLSEAEIDDEFDDDVFEYDEAETLAEIDGEFVAVEAGIDHEADTVDDEFFDAFAENDDDADDDDLDDDEPYDAAAAAILMIERLRQANAPASVNPYAEMWPESTLTRSQNESTTEGSPDEWADDTDDLDADGAADDAVTERDSITVKNLMKLVSDLGSDAALDYFRRSS